MTTAHEDGADSVDRIREVYERRKALRERFEQATGGERGLLANELNSLLQSQYSNDKAIGALLAANDALRQQVAARDAALDRAHSYAAFLYSCAACGEPPETYEWYLAREAPQPANGGDE